MRVLDFFSNNMSPVADSVIGDKKANTYKYITFKYCLRSYNNYFIKIYLQAMEFS